MEVIHDLITKYGDLVTLVSLIVGVASLLFGGYAILQSYKYNKESEKLNSDTKQLLLNLMKVNDRIIRSLNGKESENGSKICLQKEGFQLRKLSSYKKENEKKIIQELGALSVRQSALNYIEGFLTDDNRKECNVNFYSKAKYRDGADLSKIYEIMLEYDILIDVQYIILRNYE